MNIELLMRANRQEQFESSMPYSFINRNIFANCYITQWRTKVCLRVPVVVCDDAQYWEVICFALYVSLALVHLKLFGSPILQSVCKFHHDLYEVHTF